MDRGRDCTTVDDFRSIIGGEPLLISKCTLISVLVAC